MAFNRVIAFLILDLRLSSGFSPTLALFGTVSSGSVGSVDTRLTIVSIIVETIWEQIIGYSTASQANPQ